MNRMSEADKIPQSLAADGSTSGVEASDDSLIEHPFDPADIDIQTIPIPLSKILSRIEHREIRLDPEFQRGENLWGMRQKSQLIESLMMGIPLPMFYVAADVDGNWDVVDGIQRLGVFRDYILGEQFLKSLWSKADRNVELFGDGFPLNDLEFLKQFEQKKFKDLPRKQQRDIEETTIQVTVIRPGTPEAVKFNIFKRINTGGLPLSSQEIRHALHQGVATQFLKKLVSTKAFLLATTNSVKDTRMEGRELALRMISFIIRIPENYTRKDIEGFLNDSMRILNTIGGTPEPSKVPLPEYLDIDLKRLRSLFILGMKRSYALFGNYAFRKSLPSEKYRTPINKALFETWGAELARLSPPDWENVLDNKESILGDYKALMENGKFWDAISYSSSDPQKLHYRFSQIRQILTYYSF